jgi:type VI secretion system protein ImpG
VASQRPSPTPVLAPTVAPALPPALFDDFQRELEALDSFREQYRHLYPFAGLDRDDPDVLRLLEALAFFTARTRGEADRAIAGYERRALEELFPYLVSPMPSMALVAVDGTERMPEARTLPAGTELAVTPRGGPPVVYRTLRPLALRPFDIDRERVELVGRGDDGWELIIPIRSATPRVEPIGELELHLDPHGDLLAALRLHHALARHVEEVWYELPGTRQTARRCRRIDFAPAAADEVGAAPLEPFRRLLHFPLAALVLRVTVDETPPTWDRLVLRVRIGPGWPPELSVPAGVLLLHATEVVNLRRGLADPAPLDGTRARIQVAHPEPELGFAPRELVAVTRSTRAGLEPLLPQGLADDDGPWYAAEAGTGADRELWLDVHCPDAFDAASGAGAQLVVDAEWYQPDAARRLVGPLAVAPTARHLDGARWRLVTPLAGAAPSPLAGDRGRLRRLLAIGGGDLDARGLGFLLEALGAGGHELLQRVGRAIASLRIERGPDAQAPSGMRTTYHVGLGRLPRALAPVAALVFAALPGLLAAWAGTARPEVRVQSEGGDAATETIHR